MMMVLMLGSAFAAEPKIELNVSTSNVSTAVDSLDNIGAENLSTVGLETGYSIFPWFSVVAGWEYGAVKTQYGDGYSYDEYGNYVDVQSDVQSRFDYHQLHLGTRFQTKVFSRIYGYVKSEALMGMGSMRFADDLEEEDPAVEVRSSTNSFGGVVSLGAMYRSKPVAQRFQFQAHLELGYAHQSKSSFDKDIGMSQVRGLHSSLGLGIRF